MTSDTSSISAMPSTPQLPNEVLSEIFQWADTAEKFHLLVTSKLFNKTVMPLLYKNVRLKSAPQFFRFCRCYNAYHCGTPWRQVISIEVLADSHSMSWDSSVPLAGGLNTDTLVAFFDLPHLKCFRYVNCSAELEPFNDMPQQTINNSGRFDFFKHVLPELEVLELGIDPEWDIGLFPVLQSSKTRLKHLTLHSTRPRKHVATSGISVLKDIVLPELESYLGPSMLLPSLVNSPKLRSVVAEWTHELPPLECFTEHLKGFGDHPNLKNGTMKAMFRIYGHFSFFLEALSIMFPRIEVLTLDVTGEKPGPFTPAAPASFAALTSLKQVKLFCSNVMLPNPEKSVNECLREVQAVCSSLREWTLVRQKHPSVISWSIVGEGEGTKWRCDFDGGSQ